MNDQSQLLERYLTMLRENPQAEPPPELDASLANFASQMMQTPPASNALRARVWQKAVDSQAHPNGAEPKHDYFEKEIHPMQNFSIPKRRNAIISWPLLAVMAAVCVVGIWFLSRPPKTYVFAPANLQTIQPTETATASPTFTLTPSATATLTITPSFTATSTLTPDRYLGGPIQLSPTYLTPPAIDAPIIEITPAPFGGADGTIVDQLTGEKPVMVYHFVTTGDGVVAVSLSTNNLALVGLGSSVTHAGENGGGGGDDGSSNPLTVQSLGTHILVLPGDSVSIMPNANTTYSGYSPDQPIDYTLDIRYMDVIDLGSKAFEDYTDNTLNDFNPLALYKFEANAGDVITIQATGMNGFDTTLELYDSRLGPVGDNGIFIDYDSGPGYDPELHRRVLPTTGTYYVLVTPGSVGFGSYRLQLTRETVPSLNEGTQTAQFNSPETPRFTFTGHKDQTVTVNVTLPADALDYTVQSVAVTLEQDGKVIDIFNHDSALKLAQAGIVLSAPVTLQSDSPVYVTVNATGKLTRPSQQQFHLEVSIAQ